MKIGRIKSNYIFNGAIILSIILVIIIYLRYRPYSWPAGLEALGCLASIILMAVMLLILQIFKDKVINDSQKRYVTLGLLFGLLWTIEISNNNFIQPGLPLRDNIDNTFWALIALLILITAIHEVFKTNNFLSGIKAGFWSGLASGAIACLTALMIVVFGMKYLLTDPLNLKEWADIKAAKSSPGMDVYFAYQTLAGAVMHLIVLGAIMGLLLGTIGGLIGKTLHLTKK